MGDRSLSESPVPFCGDGVLDVLLWCLACVGDSHDEGLFNRGFFGRAYMKPSSRERPVLSYSSYHTLYEGIALFVLVLFLAFYTNFVWSDPVPFLVLIGIWGAGTYRYWRRPLKRVRFYENALEVSGWKVELKASYSDLENLSRTKRVLGDFKSDGVLWFSVKGERNTFSMPNRLFGKPRTELYDWLLQRNPRAVGSNSVETARIPGGEDGRDVGGLPP